MKVSKRAKASDGASDEKKRTIDAVTFHLKFSLSDEYFETFSSLTILTLWPICLRNVIGIYVNPGAIIWQSFEIINKTKCCFKNFLNGKLYGCLCSKKLLRFKSCPFDRTHFYFSSFEVCVRVFISRLQQNLCFSSNLCTQHVPNSGGGGDESVEIDDKMFLFHIGKSECERQNGKYNRKNSKWKKRKKSKIPGVGEMIGKTAKLDFLLFFLQWKWRNASANTWNDRH